MKKPKMHEARRLVAQERLELAQAALTRHKAKARAQVVRCWDDFAEGCIIPAENPFGPKPDAGRYQETTHNTGRRILARVRHRYVRYPVPEFLCRSILTYEGIERVFGERVPERGYYPPCSRFVRWFFAVASGVSLAKEARDVLTKREAHLFLQAPDTHTVEQNVWWARAKAAGACDDACDYLARIRTDEWQRFDTRWPDVVRFFATAWPNLKRGESDEIRDYLREATEDPTFSMKGRTLGSLRKLVTEWDQTFFARDIGAYVSWPTRFHTWETRVEGHLVRAVELCSNRVLAAESRRQKHCVYTYMKYCKSGDVSIVSLRWFDADGGEKKRLTLEATGRFLVQAKGPRNRSPDDDEWKVIRVWARDVGLSISSWLD